MNEKLFYLYTSDSKFNSDQCEIIVYGIDGGKNLFVFKNGAVLDKVYDFVKIPEKIDHIDVIVEDWKGFNLIIEQFFAGIVPTIRVLNPITQICSSFGDMLERFYAIFSKILPKSFKIVKNVPLFVSFDREFKERAEKRLQHKQHGLPKRSNFESMPFWEKLISRDDISTNTCYFLAFFVNGKRWIYEWFSDATRILDLKIFVSFIMNNDYYKAYSCMGQLVLRARQDYLVEYQDINGYQELEKVIGKDEFRRLIFEEKQMSNEEFRRLNSEEKQMRIERLLALMDRCKQTISKDVTIDIHTLENGERKPDIRNTDETLIKDFLPPRKDMRKRYFLTAKITERL